LLLLLLTPDHHGREFHSQVLLVAAWITTVHWFVFRDCDCNCNCHCQFTFGCSCCVLVALGGKDVAERHFLVQIVPAMPAILIEECPSLSCFDSNSLVVVATVAIDVVVVAATIGGQG